MIIIILIFFFFNAFIVFRTPIPRLPRVNGREIDLHKFYSLVCSRGGWAKVNVVEMHKLFIYC